MSQPAGPEVMIYLWRSVPADSVCLAVLSAQVGAERMSTNSGCAKPLCDRSQDWDRGRLTSERAAPRSSGLRGGASCMLVPGSGLAGVNAPDLVPSPEIALASILLMPSATRPVASLSMPKRAVVPAAPGHVPVVAPRKSSGSRSPISVHPVMRRRVPWFTGDRRPSCARVACGMPRRPSGTPSAGGSRRWRGSGTAARRCPGCSPPG